MTKEELKAALKAMTERAEIAEERPTVMVSGCTIGSFSQEQASVIIALAQAATANAIALSDIAKKSAVFIETGISINTEKDS